MAANDDLDTETLIQLSLLSEIETQSRWALAHLQTVIERLDRLRQTSFLGDNRRRWFRDRDDAYSSVQAFLTCASIVDSIISGSGPPPPRGLERVSDTTRSSVREQLHLPPGFVVGGRVQRNSLVHIEERLVEWARPGGLRGDFGTISIDGQNPVALRQTLRALDPWTLKFAVVGETCNLREIEASLRNVGEAARIAHERILDRENARRSPSSA